MITLNQHVTTAHAVYLLCVALSERQFGGNVEHDLLLSVDGVDRLRTCLTVGHIQTSPKPAQNYEGPVSVCLTSSSKQWWTVQHQIYMTFIQ